MADRGRSQEINLSNLLPAETTSFVGRELQLREVALYLSESRLLTITGPGGVGKTRLALRYAHMIRSETTKVIWVDLAAQRSADLLDNAVAAALDIRDQSTQPTRQSLVQHLRNRDLLLILDNCEHLVDHVAILVDVLLREAENIRVLATSQAFLGLPAEQQMPLSPLSLPASTSLDSSRDFEALQLLAVRGRANNPEFEITDSNHNAAIDLCQALDGNPLAIELAAVRLKTLSVSDILDRLDDRFALLKKAGIPVGQPSHHSLLDVVDWTSSQCSEKERLLWARLAVFPGCFDLNAAEKVAADETLPGPQILELLDGLIRQSVVTADTRSSTTTYILLETLRQYGQQRLGDMGGDTAPRHRHMQYFRDLAMSAAVEYFRANELRWLRLLKDKLPDLRAALDYCVTQPGQHMAGLDIAVSLARARCWFFFGTLSEGRMWLRRCYARTPEPSVLRSCALSLDGFLAVCQGDHQSAGTLFAESETTIQACVERDYDARMAVAALEFARGAGLWQLGQHDSIDTLERARRLFDDIGEHGDAHMAALLASLAASQLGNDAELAMNSAATLYNRTQRSGASWANTWALYASGVAELYHGDLTQAGIRMQNALRQQREIDDHWGPVWSIVGIAEWASKNGNHEWAAELRGGTTRMLRDTGVQMATMVPFWAAAMRTEEVAIGALGRSTFARLHAAGAAREWDAILLLGLGEQSQPESVEVIQTAPGYKETLTERELEIARLIADFGMTNKAIGLRLFIGERTVEGHVRKVLSKLSLQSRGQIAARLGVTREGPSG